MLLPSRRDFLHGAAAITGAALCGGNWAAAADNSPARTHANRGKILKSNKGAFVGRDQAEMVETLEKYKRLGFDGIETQSPGLDVPALLAAKAQVDFPVHGLVDSIHWKQRLSSPDPETRKAGREGLVQAIKDCKAIGGSAVLLVPGKVDGPEETHDDVWKRSIVEIRQVLPTAEQAQIKILIENVWNGFCEKPDQFRDYVDEINSPWVGVYFDIGNVRKFGKPEEWIAVLGKRIGKLDVKDWGVKNGFCRLGEGDVDWPAVRAALKETGYTGWATREGNDKSLADTAELMNELLDL